MKSPFVRQLFGGVLLLNLVVAAIIWFSLQQSRARYEERAAVTAQNLAQVLDENLSGTVARIDTVLQAMVNAAQRELSRGAIDKGYFDNLLMQEHSRISGLTALRATDASGRAVYGAPVTPVTTSSLAQRDYFRYLRDHPGAGLVISKPLVGGISGKWMVVLARRISHPDGSFAGLVYAGVGLDYLTKSFSNINVGPHGIIALHDDDLSLIARYPELPGKEHGVGMKILSPRLKALVEAGKGVGTYTAKSTSDGLERTFSFRTLALPRPLKVFVGLATQDYLAVWHTEVLALSLGMAVFLAMTLAGAWLMLRQWRSNQKANQEIAEHKAMLQQIMDTASVAIFQVDLQGRILHANRQMADMFGCSSGELTGSTYVELIHPSEREIGRQKMVALLRSAIPSVDLERFYWRKDGSVFWGHLVGRRFYDLHGQEQGLIGVISDVSQRKQAEDALRQSENQLAMVLRGSQLGLWDWNIATGEVKRNERWAAMLGYTMEEIRFTVENWDTLIHPEDRAEVWRSINDHLAGKTPLHAAEYRMRCKDGQWIWIRDRAMIVEYGPDGAPLRMCGTHEDISDRKALEAKQQELGRQLLHAQKLESLGVLAGGIAHDFNNILMAILGNADLALMRIAKESPVAENLRRIEQSALRAADLARQMLAYSGKGKFLVESIDLGRVLEEMLHMLKVSISKKAALRFNRQEHLPPIEADVTQVRQVIMNLVINASEALGEGDGIISVSTGSLECAEGYLAGAWPSDPAPAGLYVYLEVTDNGCGMDQETLSRVFDPFFTTKFTGRGLGMAAVLGIVRGHKGSIKVSSEPGRGTTFRILFPASRRPDRSVDARPGQEEWQGEGTVLLVDDEEAVLTVGTEILKELGFSVLTAHDGGEALEVFRNTADIACVILDLTMPRMDGVECFRELKKMAPEAKILMSSGFNEQEVTQKLVGGGPVGFIQKPYTVSVLRQAIAELTQEV
ncbi:hypothetical protein GMLC_19220 [Geomonas limicola]|uniref:histidine kinase n=1 Tax=Geomonas limicola TaxID=2740186 RepID=A0A6V8N9Y8_9BACT|nr:PAS domain S-box protein [Geomonas limicola]GFO68343.1 hypothetical protein GMLC_19220 [Geomonas limicola]